MNTKVLGLIAIIVGITNIHSRDASGSVEHPYNPHYTDTAGVDIDARPPVSASCIAFVETAIGHALDSAECASRQTLWDALDNADELLADWLRQDFGDFSGLALFADDIPVENLRRAAAKIAGHFPDSVEASVDDAAGVLADYRARCLARRAVRLETVAKQTPRLVYARHFVMGGSHYAYTEALTDAQNERFFIPGGKLCLAEATDGGLWKETVLLETKEGVIRDVDVDFDARRILFSWKKSDLYDDYHLYEMPVGDDGMPDPARVRQLTFGAGIADYEGCFLPDGSIIFNSSRCRQIVDCWWTEVSNLYRCNADGSDILRLTFDQVHDNHPVITWDNRVLYTRWEYNDRSQMYPQPLFQMSPDGTAQTAVYGENSWFPTSIVHARLIPESQNMFAIATGHHTRQPGELILIEPGRGRQETEGITRVAPVRPNPKKRPIIIDFYGQQADLFAYPYPLDSRQLLVTYNPAGWRGADRNMQKALLAGFGLYRMDIDGNREMLVSRHGLACGRVVPLAPRKRPLARPSFVDYSRDDGTFHVLDVYAGETMRDVPRGTVKTLRVVELDFRVAGIRSNGNAGEGGSALVSTPVAVGNGAWDVKIPLGDAKVHEDGSVSFKAPARRPVYFMLLDEKGRTVQTMRSWTMLQPGENASCTGCHESKNNAPPVKTRPPKALAAGVQELKPFWEKFAAKDGAENNTEKGKRLVRRGFSFTQDIQPILDRHCVSCHNGDATGAQTKKSKKPVLDLRGEAVLDKHAGRIWLRSYLTLTHAYSANMEGDAWRGRDDHPVLNWISAASAPPQQSPLTVGANSSKLFTMLDEGHAKTLSAAEAALIAAWVDMAVPFCGDYEEANSWDDAEKAKHAHYQAKRDEATRIDMETLSRLK
jgi:hypothetical protein